MQISLWYPAKAGTGTEIRFGDYMAEITTEGKPSTFRDDSAAAARGMQEFSAFYASIGASRAMLDSIYRLPVQARRNAISLREDSPLIVFAVGIDESPAQHTALAEFLAAHGYLVAAIPTMGEQTRETKFSVEGVQTHFADLVYLLRHVRAQRLTTFEKVGVIGYSFGSGAAVLLGASHPEVTAIVSLDGSIGFVDRLPVYEAVPGFKPSRLCTPLLHLNVAGSQRNELRAVSTSECGDRYIASFSDGNHLDFSTLGLLAGRFPSLRTAEWAFENSRQPARVFEAAARLILAFFDAHVRGRREAWKPPPSNALYTVTASEGAR